MIRSFGDHAAGQQAKVRKLDRSRPTVFDLLEDLGSDTAGSFRGAIDNPRNLMHIWVSPGRVCIGMMMPTAVELDTASDLDKHSPYSWEASCILSAMYTSNGA